MKDSKKSNNAQLSLIEEEKDIDQSSPTAYPSQQINISRLNTIDDSNDKVLEGEKSFKEGSYFDRDRLDSHLREASFNFKSKDVDVFKQLPEAKQLLKTIPLEHRKKVRQLIKMYEDERRDYEMEIRRLYKLLSQQQKEGKLSSNHMQIDIPNEKEEYDVTLTPTSLCFSDNLFEQVNSLMNHDQIIKMNHHVQFLNQGFDHTKIMHTEQLDKMKQQVKEKNLEIRKKQLRVEELDRHIQVLQNKIKGYEDNLKCVNQENQSLLRKIQDVEKSIRQKREESRPNITVTVTKPDQPREPEDSKLGVYKDLTVENRRATSPPDRSPTYTNRQPKISLRDELNKTKCNFSQSKQIEEHHNSQCDSSEFGKEKVVEKRKLRKLFASLLCASNTTEKKDILEKLSIEIGLKTEDVKSLFKSV